MRQLCVYSGHYKKMCPIFTPRTQSISPTSSSLYNGKSSRKDKNIYYFDGY